MPTPTLRGSSRCGGPIYTRGSFSDKRTSQKANRARILELMSSNAKNRLGTRPGTGVDGARRGGEARLLGLGLALEAKVCAGPGSGARRRLPLDAQPWFWNPLCTHAHLSLCGPAAGRVHLPHPRWPQVPLDSALLGPGYQPVTAGPMGSGRGGPSPPASKLSASQGLSPGGPSGVRPPGQMPLYAEAAVRRHRYHQLCRPVGRGPLTRTGACSAPPPH